MHTLRIDSIDSASAGASVSASAVQQMEPRTEAMSLYLSIYLYLPIYLSICIYMHMSMYMLIISSMERRCSKQKPQYVSHPSEVHFCLLPLVVQNLRK